ncbi:hypothetical protein HPB47_015394 [Ixodes persulcatus]|uniref:Uncharacterized protein n=1 Tax=Ixodes persulcatus TaxID=34615 RepID=A0AC60QTL8_IXOPE|nr:hypothetical protein HPB47_015394 [Ixodes persulcatus]
MNLAVVELGGNPSEEGLPPAKSLLIGADHFWDIVNGGVKRLDGKLMAVDTILGWTLQGPVTSTSATIYSPTTGVMRVTVSETNDAEISALLRSFWELEHIGIADKVMKTSETELRSEFNKSVNCENERCQVSLSWNEKVDTLKYNKETAHKRLRSLTARLNKNDTLMGEYDKAIREYLKNGRSRGRKMSKPALAT